MTHTISIRGWLPRLSQLGAPFELLGVFHAGYWTKLDIWWIERYLNPEFFDKRVRWV
jgi:hypothetical protein